MSKSPVSRTKTTPFTMQVSPLNPRQYEVNDMHTLHQQNLNYIEFMASLDEASYGDSYNYKNYLSPSKTSQRVADPDIAVLESQLQKELQNLEEMKRNMKQQVNEAKQALEDFRQERERQREHMKTNINKIWKYYEDEIGTLNLKIKAVEHDSVNTQELFQYLYDPNSEPLNFKRMFDLRRKIAQLDIDSTNVKEQASEHNTSK
ncbi:hypothetical protein TVAG_295430 [Trichomonas vaginalis G3]|uniref:Uncharacterized protein n=1 Tax=Trichomonas vaginalis (strain ATCC PRA-98 / G3) TaxID=412133 RepID=A2DL99_TRIV3|nr:bacterial hemolysins family [Trichomonas vaginalis G3]EAY18890.1 hypothetical protein TVAG_295430 [Trichomonas vaginalis G3]KAI5525991.1 bacterial hemolysins family [Trichomonas vaginalis G3]|eukprot:XP_001579876.1 hypothetical protein [Trichomonas vaginalis G3]